MTTHQQNIQITGVGLSCATDSQPCTMFSAVASNIHCSDMDLFLQPPPINDDYFETVITYPTEHLNNCNDANDRILLNSIIALENAIESAVSNKNSTEISNKKCLVYLMTPETKKKLNVDIEFDDWYDIFTDEDSLLAEYIDLNKIEIKFEQYSDNISKQFSRLCYKLSTGEWDTIIVGGFIHNQGQFIKINNNTDDTVNSDGATFIIIEPATILMNNNNLKYHDFAYA